jgi:hypothetical protein
MFDPQMRSLKDRVATPIAKRLRHVSPLAMSALALLVGLLASYAAYQAAYLWAFGLWYLNRALDGLDGLIARLTDSQSDFGGYVDIVTDYVIYAALPIGLVAGALSCLSLYAGVVLCQLCFVDVPRRDSRKTFRSQPPNTNVHRHACRSHWRLRDDCCLWCIFVIPCTDRVAVLHLWDVGFLHSVSASGMGKA